MSAPGITALVVLDNELLSHGVRSMLKSIPTMGSVWACGKAAEALALLPAQRPDIVFCLGSGPDTPALVRGAVQHGAKALLLLEGPDPDAVDEATLLAAHGFLMQADVTVEKLREALDRVHSGDIPLPPGMARTLMSRQTRRPARRISLTPREGEVLHLLAEGLSNKQIARRLGISEHGIKRHVTNLLAKLNSPNRTLAVALALQEGLIRAAQPA
ncbi:MULTISPECIES: response regulator transcription factor [unclassified Streptomyces]|uniref:response regulator transcription factor n=1 Tax=unclassified Streptomyces TaxID=2593676 RepID=UPI002E800976|nr:response regulator transcription factor [Streptomyces sp. NBC_00589]WTI35155.1 response regulator transcription factor [Streptomyces sp. NBC_00775]WUB31171.1 response regulator transcription factor [Streptomyces sp. NBC_00589]